MTINLADQTRLKFLSLRKIGAEYSAAECPGKEFPPANGERSNSQRGQALIDRYPALALIG